jgi:hypothetical protein
VLVDDGDGTTVARFRENKIVSFLLQNGGFDMNDLARRFYDDTEDREQFAQLISYSVSGAGDLSYVSNRVYERGDAEVENLRQPKPLSFEAFELLRTLEKLGGDVALCEPGPLRNPALQELIDAGRVNVDAYFRNSVPWARVMVVVGTVDKAEPKVVTNRQPGEPPPKMTTYSVDFVSKYPPELLTDGPLAGCTSFGTVVLTPKKDPP